MRQNIMSSCKAFSIHDEFLDDEEVVEQNQQQFRYELLNNFFKQLVPNFNQSKMQVGQLSKREYDLFDRHDMISAVDLCYKMLESTCAVLDQEVKDDLSSDIRIVRGAMQHIHNARVPPEYVPGFLILLVKYHYYA